MFNAITVRKMSFDFDPEVVPRWYAVACATYGLYLAALCYWARRH